MALYSVPIVQPAVALTFLARRIAPLSPWWLLPQQPQSTGWEVDMDTQDSMVGGVPSNRTRKLSMWTWKLGAPQPQPLKLVALPLFPLSPDVPSAPFRSYCSFCLSALLPVTLLSLLLLLSLYLFRSGSSDGNI